VACVGRRTPVGICEDDVRILLVKQGADIDAKDEVSTASATRSNGIGDCISVVIVLAVVYLT
jgi:hypothetical protein